MGKNLNMNMNEIQQILVNEMLGVQFNQNLENKGYVLSVGDGIARVYGLGGSSVR
jgi:F0F1-type ATP synthase alpha subunit